MKKCPKCNTIFLDDSQNCKRCSEPLIEIETKNEEQAPKQAKSVLPALLYTFGFMLFIAFIYFIASLIIN